jgi:uncharacterized membrane protein
MKHRLLWSLSLGIPLGLIAIRMMVTHSWTYGFYYWNLFLALIPLWASAFLRAEDSLFSLRNSVCLGMWFLFLPNAPYIITDMVHFQARPPVPIYLDEVIVYAAAWNGVLLAYASIMNVERWLLLRYSSRPVNFLLVGVFLLCGLGIYLGRFSRWNSWDVFFHPFSLVRDVGKRVVFPFHYKQTWVVSMLFGGLLALGYKMLGTFGSPAGR